MARHIRLNGNGRDLALSPEEFVLVNSIFEATRLDVRVQHEGPCVLVYLGPLYAESHRYWVYADGSVLICEESNREVTPSKSITTTWLPCESPLDIKNP